MSEKVVVGELLDKPLTDHHLRQVDLNLLTVFDTVMQLQNITRAAQVLGMSQPAVSNAVSRLKLMFNDDLFVRQGRGIQPTMRAKQLFGPVRQALQLVMNELPGTGFDAKTSHRQFNIAIVSPLDIRLTENILKTLKMLSSTVEIKLQTAVRDDIENQLLYQDVDFVVGYKRFEHSGFCNQRLFKDELVLVASADHPRVSPQMNDEQYLTEKHAVVMLEQFTSFSLPYYDSQLVRQLISFQGTDLMSVMDIVSKTQMIALVPRWLAEINAVKLNISIVSLPWMNNQLTCYLSWHESSGKDKGNMWMKALLSQSITIY